MNDESKLKHPAIVSHSSMNGFVGVSVFVLLMVFGVLFFLEGPYSDNIVKPKWYRDLKRSIPGVAENEQRQSMLAILKSLEVQGIIPATPSNDYPPGYHFQDGGADLWGTPFRFETINGLVSIRSAGPDKKYNTPDDLVYRN